MTGWTKGVASWMIGKHLYLSVPFTWLLDDAVKQAKAFKGKVHAGGPAVMLMPDAFKGIADTETPSPVPPVSVHNPLATFTTRGCPRMCKFCAVPKIEGPFRELAAWPHRPIICDNNLLAASPAHFERVLESLQPFPWCDFNQGLDARLFNVYHASLLATLKAPTIRFAFDHIKTEAAVKRAVDIAHAAGLKDIRSYVLIGCGDTPEDAHYRLEKCREWKVLPNPMRFQPLDAKRKDSYVDPAWTERQLMDTMRYYSKLSWLGGINFEEYNAADPNQMSLCS